MKGKNTKKKKMPPEKIKYLKGTYSVVQLLNFTGKLFDCIPDCWFVNEEKTLCFWPPKSGKSFTLRAFNQEIPEDEYWEVYECAIVSEGHATYSIGSAIVREKCSQYCNTSTAEEHLEAAQFRSNHPELIHKGEKSFENMFSSAKANIDQNDHREIDKENLKDQEKSQTSSKDTTHSYLDSQSHTNQSQSKNKELEKSHDVSNGAATHSHSGSQSHIHHSQSQSNRSKSEEHKKSQAVSNGSSTDSYSMHHSNRSKSSSRTHSRYRRTRTISGSKYRSQSVSSGYSRSNTTTNHSSSCKTRSRSRSKIHSSPVSRSSSSEASYSNLISLSSSNRSRSRSHFNSKTSHLKRITKSNSRSKYLLTNQNYSAQHYGNHPEKPRYIHKETNPDRARQYPQTSKSIRSPEVSSSAIRAGRNFYTHQTSTWTVGSHLNSELSTNIDLRQRSISTIRDKRNLKPHEPSTLTDRSRLNSNLQKNTSIHSDSRDLSSPSTHTRRNFYTREQTTTVGRSHRNDLSNSPYRRFEHQVTPSTDELYRGIQELIEEMKQLTNVVNKNKRRFVENDRRLTRMEVTVNKTFIMLGDLTQGINTRMSLVNSLARENTPPRGFHMPRLPITHLKELAILHRDLKNKKFRSFLINDQRDYCTPSSSTDNVVMTAYLKRFISVRVRASIVLKDLKGHSGQTLYENFHRVYLFLIDVMKAGYLMHNKMFTNNDVHSILRVVWGRSKQLLNEEINKRQRH